MGAYLVRFVRSRLEFLFIPLFFLPMWHFRFSVPALVALPIWFLEQIVSIPTEGGSGVAVTAHVAGFAYGLAVAFVLAAFGLLKKAVPHKATASPRATTKTPVIQQAPDAGALRRALDVAMFQEKPLDIDAAGARLLSAYSAGGNPGSARQLILELEPLAERQRLTQFLPAAAAFAERTGDRPLAISLYRRFCETEGAAANIVPSLVKLGGLLWARGDKHGAREALLRARQRPDCSEEWRRKIESTLAVFNE